LIPKIGKVDNIIGKMAQCMAQAMEVAIPNASQLTFKVIIKIKANIINCNNVAK